MATAKNVLEEKQVSKRELTNKAKRPERVPVTGLRKKLDVAGKDPNYHYTWQDVAQLHKFLEGGYERVVTTEVKVPGSNISKDTSMDTYVTRPGDSRGRVTLILLRIKKEWFDEDNASRDNKTKETTENLHATEDGQYGSVKIT